MSRSSVLKPCLVHSHEKTSRDILSNLIRTLEIWLARRSGRRELSSLDDGQLKDVGISRAEVLREIGKPFWRP